MKSKPDPVLVSQESLKVYDETLQTLFGVALQLEYLQRVVEERPEEARSHIDLALTRLGELMTFIRERISRLT